MGKYYTPTLEEIHVGLECEWQSKIRGEAWNKQVFDVDLVSIAYDTLEHDDIEEPFSDQFRIKYLDENDLIELGWEFDSVVEGDYFYVRGNMIEGNYFLTTQDYRFFYINPGAGVKKDESFVGQVKNKTEMKKLMEMLNIKPPKQN